MSHGSIHILTGIIAIFCILVNIFATNMRYGSNIVFVVMLRLKINFRTGAISSLHDLRIYEVIPSCPHEFEELSFAIASTISLSVNCLISKIGGLESGKKSSILASVCIELLIIDPIELKWQFSSLAISPLSTLPFMILNL